jgi:bifunctional DNA-binding transcriptional regulator/antitoxin component of YhaV-PrlF toxin-antitoxin module
MATLRIHYEGWVALPESFRRKLGLERGDDLEAELVEGTIVLRPAKGSAKAVQEAWLPMLPRLCQHRRSLRRRCRIPSSRTRCRKRHPRRSVVGDRPRPKLRRRRCGGSKHGG